MPQADWRARSGGSLGLADIIAHHGEALEYDLMTKTRYLLHDIGRALPERALLSFVKHLPPESALRQEIDPDAVWLTERHEAMLLAAISDQLAALAYMFSKAHGGKPKKPKPIPRPGVSDGSQHIGKDPIPIEDFDSWYYGEVSESNAE